MRRHASWYREWGSDVCSCDLVEGALVSILAVLEALELVELPTLSAATSQMGRESWRVRVVLLAPVGVAVAQLEVKAPQLPPESAIASRCPGWAEEVEPERPGA